MGDTHVGQASWPVHLSEAGRAAEIGFVSEFRIVPAVRSPLATGANGTVKRVFDIVAALLLVIPAIPVAVVIALAIAVSVRRQSTFPGTHAGSIRRSTCAPVNR